MNRFGSVLFALLLLALVVIAFDPNARQKATAMVQNLEPTLRKWNNTVVVKPPTVSVTDADRTSTPVPTVTPVPTAVADNGNHEIIPNTGDDSTEKPIIQINWDALGQALRNFWDQLRNIRIDFNPPRDNK